MQSEIIGNFILLGSCGRHWRQMTKDESRMQTNQIQASSLNQEDDKVLILIMDTMSIKDMDHMEIQQDLDWLDLDTSALVCNTFISSQIVSHHKKLAPQPQRNHSSDFKPFAPNYQSTNFMPVISNLHQVKDCEFDHTYILSHLEHWK